MDGRLECFFLILFDSCWSRSYMLQHVPYKTLILCCLQILSQSENPLEDVKKNQTFSNDCAAAAPHIGVSNVSIPDPSGSLKHVSAQAVYFVFSSASASLEGTVWPHARIADHNKLQFCERTSCQQTTAGSVVTFGDRTKLNKIERNAAWEILDADKQDLIVALCASKLSTDERLFPASSVKG